MATYKRVCRGCSKEFETMEPLKVYCEIECRRSYNIYEPVKDYGEVPRGTVGAIAELAVSIDLMAKGYSVFRPLSPNCFCDLIAIKGDEIKMIEVRSGNKDSHGVVFSKKRSDKVTDFAVYIHAENSITYIKTEA